MATTTRTRLDGSFIIRSRFCSDCVLANVLGQARIVWRDVTNPNQLWTIYQDYSGLTGLNKYWLRNQGNGLELCAPENSKDLPFQTNGDAWELGGDGKFTTWNAWRVQSNARRNLNALGNGRYDVGTFVGVWGWAGGDPNELWQAIDMTGKKILKRINGKRSPRVPTRWPCGMWTSVDSPRQSARGSTPLQPPRRLP